MAANAAADALAARQRRGRFFREEVFPWLLLLPALGLNLVVVAIPALGTFYFAFTRWSGMGAAEWVGLANFERMLREPEVGVAFANNVRWIHERPDDYQTEVKRRLAGGLGITASEYLTVQRARYRIREAVRAAFETVDLLANPTTNRVAPPISLGPKGNGDQTYKLGYTHSSLLRFPSMLGLPGCSGNRGSIPASLVAGARGPFPGAAGDEDGGERRRQQPGHRRRERRDGHDGAVGPRDQDGSLSLHLDLVGLSRQQDPDGDPGAGLCSRRQDGGQHGREQPASGKSLKDPRGHRLNNVERMNHKRLSTTLTIRPVVSGA